MKKLSGLLFVSILTLTSEVSAEWLVDEDGRCVNRWTPASLLIGPTVMLDAPLVPLRFMRGGFEAAWNCPASRCSRFRKTCLGILGVGLGLVYGTLSASFDAAMGYSAFVTAGWWWVIVPDETRLSLRPINFVPIDHENLVFERPVDHNKDLCGRVRWPDWEEEPPHPWFDYWFPPSDETTVEGVTKNSPIQQTD